jgi:hypothetical protein
MIEAVCKSADCAFYIAEINEHTALITAFSKLFSRKFRFYLPAVSVYICTLSLISRKEMCTVK